MPSRIPRSKCSRHSCALLTGGAIKCWGHNNFYQLGVGDGSRLNRNTPVDVSGISTATSIALGGSAFGYYSCALLTGGTIKCWGDNSNGQLGVGTNTDRDTPVDVIGLYAPPPSSPPSSPPPRNPRAPSRACRRWEPRPWCGTPRIPTW